MKQLANFLQHQNFILEFFFAFSSEIHFELNILCTRDEKRFLSVAKIRFKIIAHVFL
jgi:hypothetical protein